MRFWTLQGSILGDCPRCVRTLYLSSAYRQIFDKEKMDLIKSIVFHVSKISEDDQFGRDDLWVRCKMKIDKWNRDLRYRYWVSTPIAR